TRASAIRLLASRRSIAAAPQASDIGADRRGLFIQRALQRFGQELVVFVAGREDPALRDLAGQVFQDLPERLLGDALGARIVDVDLAVSHRVRGARSRVLLSLD